MMAVQQKREVDYNLIRQILVAHFQNFNIHTAQAAARFRDLSLGLGSGSSLKEGEWHLTVRGKEKKKSTRKGGGWPVQGESWLNDWQSWSPVSPTGSIDEPYNMLLNYFYNTECPNEEEVKKRLLKELWISYRKDFAGKKAKPGVMMACHDMLEQILVRTRRKWIKGAKFKDFQWDDVVTDSGGVSRSSWSNTYSQYWFKLRKYVDAVDMAGLDIVRKGTVFE